MKKEYRWEDFVAKILNFLTATVFLPIKGLWWLLKRVTSDISKNAYGRLINWLSLLLLLGILGFLFK